MTKKKMENLKKKKVMNARKRKKLKKKHKKMNKLEKLNRIEIINFCFKNSNCEILSIELFDRRNDFIVI